MATAITNLDVLQKYCDTATKGNVSVAKALFVDRLKWYCKMCDIGLTTKIPEANNELDYQVQEFVKIHAHTGGHCSHNFVDSDGTMKYMRCTKCGVVVTLWNTEKAIEPTPVTADFKAVPVVACGHDEVMYDIERMMWRCIGCGEHLPAMKTKWVDGPNPGTMKPAVDLSAYRLTADGSYTKKPPSKTLIGSGIIDDDPKMAQKIKEQMAKYDAEQKLKELQQELKLKQIQVDSAKQVAGALGSGTKSLVGQGLVEATIAQKLLDEQAELQAELLEKQKAEQQKLLNLIKVMGLDPEDFNNPPTAKPPESPKPKPMKKFSGRKFR